jgi:hypothetical protein
VLCILWLIKSRDSGGNLNLNDRPLPGRFVTATQSLNGQEVDGNLLKQISEFLGDAYCGKFKHWFS